MCDSPQPAPDPTTVFEIFRDRIGRWCIRRVDGQVFGVFQERRAALRFVWWECPDTARLTLIDKTVEGKGATSLKAV